MTRIEELNRLLVKYMEQQELARIQNDSAAVDSLEFKIKAIIQGLRAQREVIRLLKLKEKKKRENLEKVNQMKKQLR